ncbi:sensor histidine kinase-like protein/response regulator [Paraphoma chrysanthemicola]|uniref:histidine kinase n=1 Tax=Paraphoma chrysanthemicola TaxID=798071 RepID=A0A8K0RF86_9PLEO|nr:sensor histidine kinase-like protein/response regulator [Paraphoma chrysanthemicola]
MADRLEPAPPRSHGRARKKMDQVDLAKERNFYLYYPQRPQSGGPLDRQTSPSPVREVTLPASPAPTVEDAVPNPPEDKALSAFAQLGALRLNARRCLISFFDRKNCYILAEATRTLCIHNGQAELSEDDLCWGNVIFPKEMSLCHYTVNLRWDATSLLNDFSTHPSLVVNDLTKDDRFKDYPFVAGPPYSRFYAGVPIRSPTGHSIGTYCVLDDKPRDGLKPQELIFLKDMASTVMRHLEMVRATEDQRRGKIMVKSLGSFAEGKSGLENWWADPWDSTAEQPTTGGPEAPPMLRQRSSNALPDTVDGLTALGRSNRPESSVPSIASPNNASPASAQPASAAVTPATEEPLPEIRPEVSSKLSSSTNDGHKDRTAPEIKAAFTRAANMIVDATEAEGAAFFDAKISTFGGLVDDDLFSEQLPEPDKPCVLLGAALCKNNRGPNASASAECSMSESVLRHLLRSYPHGHIFNLDDDSNAPPVNSPSGGGELEMSDGFPFTVSRKSESMRSLDDESYLRTVFPNAQSLVLYPLWDPHRDRWFASAFIWSSNPMRVFTSEQELSYLAAFSNSVMAEVARLDMKLADAAKADFISSISHELRSPLHGILGMTDLLKDSYSDNQQASHVATIETCGKTLLETINHVLDFAKINNLTRGASKRQKKRTKSSNHMIVPGQAHTNDIMTLINDVDMGVLTEDVVETVFAGYTYQRTSAQSYDVYPQDAEKLAISVILDINRSENYVFRTQPGAWRRVIMNLFGNSLKYTPAGYIKVKLETRPKRDPTDESCEFRFTVTDSGIGMSEEYVNNRLFHSFAQENSLSQGTGLGLSIVKQIVESLGGEVEVRSEKGRGTKFTVTCPLKESAVSPTFCPAGSEREKERQLLEVAKRTQGMKVRFVGFDEEEEYFVKSLKNKTATKLSLKALDNLCTDWFGMERSDNNEEPDLVIATESCAKWLRAQHSKDPEKASTAPVIVICQGAASAQSTTAVTVPGIVFECIGQPVGPHKMAKALSSCLDRHTSRIVEQTTKADTALPQVSQLSLKENSPPPKPDSSPHILDPPRPPFSHVSSAPEIRSVTPHALKKSIYTKPSRALNCLAVDDNPINLRLLRTFIDKLGHRHVLAVNGLEALEAYKAAQTPDPSAAPVLHPLNGSARIDVILMDINMPIMDGLEATRQIRAHEIRNNLPKVTIIALTGVADAEIQHEANSSGINLFLIKPVRLADLEVVLKGVITGQDNAIQELKLEKEKEEERQGVLAAAENEQISTDVGIKVEPSVQGIQHTEETDFAHTSSGANEQPPKDDSTVGVSELKPISTA